MPIRYKLLIIDDEPDVREAIRDVLSNRFKVFTASSGKEGLKIAKETKPDLILLDLLMVEMDGIATCRALRAEPKTRDIPIIMITAANDDDRRADALLAGVDDLVSKPFRPKEFLIRILSRVRSRREPARKLRLEGVSTCGNLTIDPDRFEAFLNGKKLDLTVIDMGLLKFFVRNKGIILSRERILDAVWQERDVSDRVVDNHILSLRKKLVGFDHEIISVYGAGYGLKPKS